MVVISLKSALTPFLSSPTPQNSNFIPYSGREGGREGNGEGKRGRGSGQGWRMREKWEWEWEKKGRNEGEREMDREREKVRKRERNIGNALRWSFLLQINKNLNQVNQSKIHKT